MEKNRYGFSLIELMVVVSIVAFLSMIAIPSLLRFLSKAKRTEAYLNLSSLYVAEKAYYAEHGRYSDALYGSESIGWKPEGYNGGGKKERFNYTYGFNHGSEGHNYFTGKLETPASDLLYTKADREKFIIAAAGDIDNDGKADVLTVDEYNNIKIITDDLL